MHPFLFELSCYFKNAYPPFVTQKNPNPINNYIPVFISHKVTKEEFEEKLIFLKQNNYKTITVSELYSFITGKSAFSSPSVCLTFDDGHRSLYEIAFPLLKEYNLKAAAFIVPAFIGNTNWITWTEAKEMSNSGAVEIQSHTLEHKKIFIGSKITGYNYPGLFKNELGLDKPTVILNGKETKDVPIGHPIYKMDSRMSDRLRYLEDNKWETHEQQSNAILLDLTQSKKILEERLNKPVQHLAYPWGIGSALSQKLSKEAGFLSNFWGPISGIPYNKIGTDPYKLIRLKDDYIFRLHGQNRKSLLSIFKLKFNRRKYAKEQKSDIY